MTRRPKAPAPCPETGLLDQEAWDAPRRLTADDLFTHGGDGWRRAGFDHDDPEDFR